MNENAGAKIEKKKRPYGDLIAKILCVLFAFLLWFYVMLVESPADERVIRDVPVQVDESDRRMLEQGLSVYTDYEETVDITLLGKRRILSKITAGDIVVKADLSGIAAAGKDLVVPLIISPPDGCQLVSSTKYNTQISAESMKKVLVPLKAQIINANPSYIYSETPVFSFTEDGETTTVTGIFVEGPSSMVDAIEFGMVKVNAADMNREFTEQSSIELVNEDGKTVSHRFLKQEYDFVSVTVNVETEVSVPLTCLFKQGYFTDTDTTYTINPPEVTVRCSPIDAERADLILPIELDEQRILKEEHITDHGFQTTVQLISPYSKKITPSEVMVDVSIDRNIINRRMIVVDILSTGGIEVDCSIIDGFIEDVVVCGSKEALSEIKSSDLVAMVDLSEYTQEHVGKRFRKKVNIVIDSEYGDEVFIVGDYSVEIEITEKK